MSHAVHAPIRFGAVEVRPSERTVLVRGRPTALGARAFDLLLTLIEQRDRVVPKSELFERVWPGLVVEENNLQVQISSLRKLLGPQAIATIPGRGYRFSAALDGAMDGDARAAHGVDPAAVAAAVADAPLTNLPRELPPLFGREADLAVLCPLIETHKLVTVVGAGGIGKSRLAQAAARALAGGWTDGAWMVELAGLSDPTLLPNVVAQSLQITLSGHAAAQDELVAALAQRNLLIVLDNCEHLLDATAGLVQAVMQAAPDVNLLATSQEPLHLAVEQQYRVLPLAVPAESSASSALDFGAVALFGARVRAFDPRFPLNEETLPLVADICRRLDGLPLAIELAAARVATLGLRPVRDKLDARFKLLTGGARTTLRRHQTLRAALEWSHNLLNDAERAVFRRLGVFAGGFSMEMAQAVAGDAQLDEWTVLEQLSALVDKSLVVADAGDVPRYRLLETARAFALEQLAQNETADALRRHALAMLDFLRRVDDANLDGELRTDQYATLVLPELDNLRSAHAWATGDDGDLQVAIALAAHAGSLIDYAIECVEWLVPLRARVEEGVVEPAVAARYWRAVAAGNMAGRVPLAVQAEAAERAQSLYRELGHPRRVFSSLMRLALYRNALGQETAGKAALDQARSLIRPDWPAEFRILLLRRDAWLARQAGRYDEALALYREELRASESAQDWRLEVMARGNIVDLLWETGPVEEALRKSMELMELVRARPAAIADMDYVYASLLGILSEMDRIEEASALAPEALLAMRRARQYYVEHWAYFYWRRGQNDVAARLVGVRDATREASIALQTNERRLYSRARAGLEAELPRDALARLLEQGKALGETETVTLIASALEAAPRRVSRVAPG